MRVGMKKANRGASHRLAVTKRELGADEQAAHQKAWTAPVMTFSLRLECEAAIAELLLTEGTRGLAVRRREQRPVIESPNADLRGESRDELQPSERILKG